MTGPRPAPGAVFAQLFTRDPLTAESTRAEVATRLTGVVPSAGSTLRRYAREWSVTPAPGPDFLWSDAAGQIEVGVHPIRHPDDTHSVISLECPLPGADLDEVCRRHRELGERLDADFGHVTVLGPEDGVLPVMYLTPTDLRRWLPEVWHALLLGEPYVRLIGADRIRSAPAATVERVGPRAFWLGLGPLGLAVTDEDRRAEQARRAAVQDHLGSDLFWRPDRRVYRTPAFPGAIGTAAPDARPGRVAPPIPGTP